MSVPTLSEFFECPFRKFRLDTKDRDIKTIKSYEESVDWWMVFTGDPPMDRVRDEDVADFIIYLQSRPGKQTTFMKASSICKHCRNLKTIFRFACPKSIFPGGRGIIQSCPYFDPPKPDKGSPGSDWTTAEVRQMFAAADSMKWPNVPDVATSDWWRCYLALSFFTGMRIHALMRSRYSQIHERWLTSAPEDSKGGRGHRQWLHSEAMEMADIIRRPDRDIILSIPGAEPSVKRCLYKFLRVLQKAAGITQNRRWACHSFRKTHLTHIAMLGIEGNQALKVAQHSAGHANLSMTTGVYVNGTVQERLVASYIDRLPSLKMPDDQMVELPKVLPEPSPAALDPSCFDWMG